MVSPRPCRAPAAARHVSDRGGQAMRRIHQTLAVLFIGPSTALGQTPARPTTWGLVPGPAGAGALPPGAPETGDGPPLPAPRLLPSNLDGLVEFDYRRADVFWEEGHWILRAGNVWLKDFGTHEREA